MANQLLLNRMDAIRQSMMAKYRGGGGLSTVTTGDERESFKRALVEMVVAPPFRIDSGEIIDSASRQSGPLDLVIEHEGSLSFPLEPGSSRLYLAEGVAAVVEVKSSLPGQWTKAIEEAEKVAVLRKSFEGAMSFGVPVSDRIPVIVAGYVGWKDQATFQEKIQHPIIDGILSLEPAAFLSKSGIFVHGPATLLGFFAYLQAQMRGVLASIPNYQPYVT